MISLNALRRFAPKLALGAAMIAVPAASFASVFISVGIAPPPLPVYAQPPIPGDGYLWTPGYWAYGPVGYYWVPGVWVQPPTAGVLWTPGYWGFYGGQYRWNEGYWGPHVGFYGGVNYGFGFGGVGFEGGYWNGGHFFYNRAVANVNVGFIHNVYARPVPPPVGGFAHVAFNGGPGGLQVRASAQEMQAAHEQHFGATSNQAAFRAQAQNNPAQRFSANGGHPGTPAAASVRDGFGHANEVNSRQGNQQARINQGVNSGQLTPGETRNLQQRDNSIHQQAQADRAANGGALNQQQRAQINQRQNNVSQSINNDKHNANSDAAAAARQDRAPQQEQKQAQHAEKNNAPHPKEDRPRK